MRTRIKVVGGPWPERIGLKGWIVTDELDPNIYPRYGLGKRETIILLDGEPSWQRGWSCVISKENVEVIPHELEVIDET